MSNSSKKTPIQSPPAHPELVAAIAKLGLSDRAVEREAGVPQGFVCKLRKGECGSVKAAPSVARLLALVEVKGVSVALAVPPVGISVKAANHVHAEEDVVPDELARLVEESDSHEAIGKTIKTVAGMVVTGRLDRFTGAAIESLLKSRGASLEREEAEKARSDAGKPQSVTVRYENDWRGAPACEACGGSGLLPVGGA